MTDGDLPAVLTLNQSETPHVGDLDVVGLSMLVQIASPAFVATDEEGLAGFVIAVQPGRPYGSENYRWFKQHYEDFHYVDRVVVAERARGQGLARSLYDAVIAAKERSWLLAEVNLDPPNEGSQAFHAKLGFDEVGQQTHGGKLVSLVARSLS